VIEEKLTQSLMKSRRISKEIAKRGNPDYVASDDFFAPSSRLTAFA
jgi:hypothetical protein